MVDYKIIEELGAGSVVYVAENIPIARIQTNLVKSQEKRGSTMGVPQDLRKYITALEKCGEAQRIEQDSLFVPPKLWFHQHFNIGKEPARYLAIHAEHSLKYKGIRKTYEVDKDIKLGGGQIEYEDEDPEIRMLFKEELAKTGAPWRMSKFFPGE